MAIDWSKLFKKYNGMWVALKDDEKTVVAKGRSVKEVIEKARKTGYHNPILFRVPTRIIPYVGSLR